MNLSTSERVLDVKDLTVDFASFGDSVNIVEKLNFHINKGETLGVVGESGCGKSMTALALMRLINSPPGRISGSVNLDGRELLSLSEREMEKVRGNKISMIFQEPMTSLNPAITVGKQLMEVYVTHQGMSWSAAREKAIESLETVRIALPKQRVDEFPHQLSGGMRQRVMIAMAMSCQPKLLIADEPTTALDVTIQAQILNLMRELRENTGTSIMLITHDLGVVSEVCSRAIIIYSGQIIEEGRAEQLFENPLHPYTVGLLHSLPEFASQGRLHVIEGSVPPPGKKPDGCVFHPRCPRAMDKCRTEVPEYVYAGDGHSVKCWLHTGSQ